MKWNRGPRRRCTQIGNAASPFPRQLENKKTNSLVKIGPKVRTGISPKKIHRMQTSTRLATGVIKTRASYHNAPSRRDRKPKSEARSAARTGRPQRWCRPWGQAPLRTGSFASATHAWALSQGKCAARFLQGLGRPSRSVWAAVTGCRRGARTPTSLSRQEAGRPRWGPQVTCLGGTASSGTLAFTPCPHVVRSLRAQIPSQVSRPRPDGPQRPRLLIPSNWGLGSQQMRLGEGCRHSAQFPQLRGCSHASTPPHSQGSWHPIGGGDQNHPQEEEMQKGKVAVWGGLTNS